MDTLEQPIQDFRIKPSDTIYSDRGGERGLRTRLFRNCATGTGVEWIYASDYEGPFPRWYGYLAMGTNASIDMLVANGMTLEPYAG